MITLQKKDFPKDLDFDVGSKFNIMIIGTISSIEEDIVSLEPEEVSPEIIIEEEAPKTPTADDELETKVKKPKIAPKTPTADELEEEEI